MPFHLPSAVEAQLKRVPGLRPLVRYFRYFRQRRGIEAKRLPPMVAIELTNACDLSCAKCARVALKRPMGFLDAALFRKILGDIQESGQMTEVALSGSGEPTLHKQLVEFVEMARAVPNVGVLGFASSMSNMTPDLSERLLKAGMTRLKVSLDADDPETYERLYGVDVYAKVVENLSSFCEINQRMGEPCTITIKVTLYTDDSRVAKRLKDAWAGRVHHVRATRLHNWAGAMGPTRQGVRTEPCSFLRSMTQICWDGQITLCCFDSYAKTFNMGNARNVNLVDYWRRDLELRRVKRVHWARDFSTLPVCAACNVDQYHDVDFESSQCSSVELPVISLGPPLNRTSRGL